MDVGFGGGDGVLPAFFASLEKVKMAEQDDDCQNLVVAELMGWLLC